MGQHTEGLTTDSDLLAVGLVDDVVDELEVVGVRDDLVVADEVLKTSVSKKVACERLRCMQNWLAASTRGRGRLSAQSGRMRQGKERTLKMIMVAVLRVCGGSVR